MKPSMNTSQMKSAQTAAAPLMKKKINAKKAVKTPATWPSGSKVDTSEK
jgi:hypothetical protein